jgi:chemotaxis protein methyltransferase CheR
VHDRMTVLLKKDLMTDEEFSLLRDLVHREFGILLRGDKRLTIHTRISHRLSVLGLRGYREYYDFIQFDSSGEELFELASHITNNETYFFREKSQLELFSNLLKEIKTKRQKRNEQKLRVLSLASSSGEEAYSLNILVQESGHFLWDWDIRITGIDINRLALKKAGEASYTKNSFRGLNGDSHLVDKYFNAEGERYVLRRSLTRNVDFRHGNILDAGSYIGLEPTDVIFCRNVLIYMSDEAIGRLARNLHGVLSETGYLFIGSSESLIQKTNLFVPEYRNGVIVYRKNAGI